jgi:hypothetical protein
MQQTRRFLITFGIDVTCVNWLAAFFMWTFALLPNAHASSAKLEAFTREAEELDRQAESWNARCGARYLEGAALAQCQQEYKAIAARRENFKQRFFAYKQAEAAERDSQSAVREPNLETAHKNASAPFDGGRREGNGPSFDSNVVDARGLVRTPSISEVPQRFRNNKEIMGHDTEARRWASRAEQVEQKLTHEEKQRQAPGNHAQLEVQIAHDRNELIADKSRSRVEELKKQESIHFQQSKLE